MKPSYLSTGQAAKILSVTPDTVLKWIKSGKLSARSTTGGHYRIHSGELERLKNSSHPAPVISSKPFRKNDFLYCWEYNNAGGPSNTCESCFVYKTRAQRCYEVMKLEKDIGHKKFFCDGSCRSCEYFYTVRELKAGVLLITSDENLAAVFLENGIHRNYKIEIADCGYSCSAILERFKPDCILMDCSMGFDAVNHIWSHLSKDPRIPGSRLILVGGNGEFPDNFDKDSCECVEKPFGIEELEKLCSSVAMD